MEIFNSWQDLFNWLPEVWGWTIFTVDDRAITLGKMLTGLLLLVMGYYLCKNLAKQIERRVLTRLDIDPALKYTLKTMIFYVMLIILTLFTLRLLNVPITIFTVVGGALAIGVGFGSQNIVNNFISGLIIMIEQPIRVGDFIEVDKLFGTVEHIGARSTRIKSMENTHIVVPNSSFLEKNVLNWTLSDNVVRTSVVVGVAYGSPTRTVEKLIREAVSEQERVLPHPAPVVLFADFGDNSLNFKVFFWTRIRTVMQLRETESEIRFRIDELFREAGVTIAFPQRDVHLDTLSPLKVEIINPDKASL